ncbi:heavy metal translocating P-type ATPase [Alkalibacter saccharofermentans]|uniref:Cd(2+)-exporting ATPase n=1 Tax=Alkalibacter saccharofermentans DSM 14828 TaxID=1120975 RepID=A0A1M4YMM0_9FIRM|nr:heavy metal translocating P-type ATPase [Alkalibacter saccharofermentans]SHF06903.1 Cd2+/Zn2+-exporting ATPase [Alkalibacter saccharofermentans DSM 14828]
MFKIILEGLNCTSCAGKIEERTNKISGVKRANLNFVSSTMEIEFEDEKLKENIISQIKKIVNKLEPHVNVRIKDRDEEEIHLNLTSDEVCDISNEKRENSKTEKKGIVPYFFTNYRLLAGIGIYIYALFFSGVVLPSLFWYLAGYMLIGFDVIKSALRNIVRREIFDENFLMFIATVGAFSIGEYGEGVAVMLFYEVGEVFQSYAVDNSRRSIKELVDLKAMHANKYSNGKIERVFPESLNLGDEILIKPGEKMPVDGEIYEGRSLFDTSALTGESLPRELSVGDKVLGGFINSTSAVKAVVKKTYRDSAVAKILDLIENAGAKKSNTEKFITKFARYYTPAVVSMAVAISIIPTIVTGDPFSEWLHRGLIFLVISCPCALVISIPLGYFGGIGAASKEGILIKGSQYLEALKNMETVVFDKTGTLTKGIFQVTQVVLAEGVQKDEFMECAALAESMSNHPIGASIMKAYNKELSLHKIEKHTDIGGKGVKVIYDGIEILAGNHKLMEDAGIKYLDFMDIGTVVHVASGGKYLGYILIADEIKDGSLGLVEDLKSEGIKKTVMFTGDHKNIADYVAGILNMDEVKSELLPQEKVEHFEILKKDKRSNATIGFVGDGINDAPVLAMADIGISMGSLGSDAAVEASDIVLMKDDPKKLVQGIKIAKYTNKIVVQNIVFALGIKGVVMLLGALGYASMWAAVFADVGVTLIAVLNVSRIFYVGGKLK